MNPVSDESGNIATATLRKISVRVMCEQVHFVTMQEVEAIGILHLIQLRTYLKTGSINTDDIARFQSTGMKIGGIHTDMEVSQALFREAISLQGQSAIAHRM